MAPKSLVARLRRLASVLGELSELQLAFLESVVAQFMRPFVTMVRLSGSDIIDDAVMRDLGDTLRIHHCLSREPLSKDRFEYALERTLLLAGRAAKLATKTNRGHDITIDGVPYSLKTQANSGIRDEQLHISKFMELGKGAWKLPLLRDQFISHMGAYERILTLRCLRKGPPCWRYELVEIPKALLQLAMHGELRVMTGSGQTPQPGYCDVRDETGAMLYQLYFDGGTERKLQIKALRKDLCVVHAEWEFEVE